MSRKRGKRSFNHTWQARLLARRLQRHAGTQARIQVIITDNRAVLVHVRRKKPVFRARLHYMFVDAPPKVIRALAGYVVRADQCDSRLIDHYITANAWRIRGQSRQPIVRPYGRFHNLQAIFEDLNRGYFDGLIEAQITWGRRTRAGRGHRRESIKMGSYCVEDRLIRVHPALDRPDVPRFFVEWIVHHEMLHVRYEIYKRNGRHQFHTTEFLAAERRFPHYERALRWQKENLDRLLAA